MTPSSKPPGSLIKDDLIPDARLREGEPDAFKHQAIAARLADLAVVAEAPVNVALFGPWGSGKSSFFELLRSELQGRGGGVELVRYDAWKFGGKSLKRNFISSAATELGFDEAHASKSEFHRGLYETTKTVEFKPLELLKGRRWMPYALAFVIALGIGAVVTLVMAVLAAWARETAVRAELGGLATTLGTSVVGIVFILGTALKMLSGADVAVEKTSPSEDEQFERVFRRLVEKALKKRRTTRLVFFIDELDRCSKADVVATLTSLRTFLDQPHCVFIVAADREVLEEALDEVEQATPVREEDPYYSSASAFLDKIFQHQFALPPLRGGRVSGFARELVAAKGGLWAELRDADRLDAVLYALIPSHVRAPRRAKVLLNNFATNVRVIESRGIDWLARAPEIAKLTVLQTEFPVLASDLEKEPKLPALLLDPPETGAATPRQEALLHRHSFAVPLTAPSDSEDEVEGEESYQPPDRMLPDASSPALLRRQREDLKRYLESRAATPNPGRDLLFLETAGDWAGLDNLELNQIIDDEAASRPGRVVEALARAGVGDRIAAARLLGQMSEVDYGPERVNVLTSLAGALEGIDPADLRGELGDLVSNIESYQAAEQLIEEQLPGLLVLAVAAEARGLPLATQILEETELLENPKHLNVVARMLGELSAALAGPVEVAVAKAYPTAPGVLLEVIRTEAPETVIRLLSRAQTHLIFALIPTAPLVTPPAPAPAGTSATATAAQAAPDVEADADGELTPEESEGLIETLLEALESAGPPLLSPMVGLMRSLLNEEDDAFYSACKERAVRVAASLPGTDRNRLALIGLRVAPPEDWRVWSDLLVPGGATPNDQAVFAIRSIVNGVDPEADTTMAATASVSAVLALGDLEVPAAAVESIKSGIDSKLDPTAWWSSPESARRRAAVYGFTLVIARLGTELAADLEARVMTDFLRAGPTAVPWSPNIAQCFVETAAAVPDAALVAAAEEVATYASDFVLQRVQLASEQKARGLDIGTIPVADVVASATSSPGVADVLLSAWLGLAPPANEVVEALTTVDSYSAATRTALSSYCDGLEEADRGALFLALVEADMSPSILAAAAAALEASTVLPKMADLMAEATAGSRRSVLAKAVATLRLDTPGARRAVAAMAYDLLTVAPSKTNSDVAADLLGLVKDDLHGYKQKLTAAIQAAAGADKVRDGSAKKFVQFGLMKRKKRGGFLGALGRG